MIDDQVHYSRTKIGAVMDLIEEAGETKKAHIMVYDYYTVFRCEGGLP